MSDSLATIAKAMNRTDFKILKKFYPDKDKFDLLIKKGVYPYDKVQDFSYYDRTSLPPIEDFYSTMRRCGITTNRYTHAKKVWETFNCQNFGEYTDLYCESDVLILQIVLKSLGILVLSTMNLIYVITFQHQDFHGIVVSSIQK